MRYIRYNLFCPLIGVHFTLKYTPKIGHKKIWRFKIGQSKVSETDSKRIRGSIFHNLGFEAII